MNRHDVKEIYDDLIVTKSGSKYYYKDNYLYKIIHHNVDLVCYYNKSGEYHRLDGPAIEYGKGIKSYYIDGCHYFYGDWLEKVEEYAYT